MAGNSSNKRLSGRRWFKNAAVAISLFALATACFYSRASSGRATAATLAEAPAAGDSYSVSSPASQQAAAAQRRRLTTSAEDANHYGSSSESSETVYVFSYRHGPRGKDKNGDNEVDDHRHPIARKQEIELATALGTDRVAIKPAFLTLDEQRDFLGSRSPSCGGQRALDKFDEFVEKQQEHFAVELWKYCALQSEDPGKSAVAYIDASSPLLVRLQTLLAGGWPSSSSVAVLGDSYFPKTIHGSLLLLRPEHRQIAVDMLKVLIETPVKVLEASPLLLPRTLYALISVATSGDGDDKKDLKPGGNGKSWYLLEQTCHVDPLRRSSDQLSWTDTNSYRLAHHCPEKSGFCCSVYDTTMRQAVLMSRHPLLPYQVVPSRLPNRPYNAEAGHYQEDELPFISTIREEVFQKPEDHPATPNFFDVLAQNNCLPSDEMCSKCLREKKGSDCNKCAKACPCFCKTLCQDEVEPKFVKKKLVVTPPLFSRDPNRIIPRVGEYSK